MKLARRTSPCVACGAPIVVDTPIAPLLGQNGRIRLGSISAEMRAGDRRDDSAVPAYGGCAARAPPPQPCPRRRPRCALAHPPLVDASG